MSTELDLQMMLFDQFLNSSEATLAIQDTSITSGDEYEQAKDSFSSPPLFASDMLDMSSLNMDLSSTDTTATNTTVTTPSQDNILFNEKFLEFNFTQFDFSNNSNYKKNSSLQNATPSPLHINEEVSSQIQNADPIDLNNLLNLNPDMFVPSPTSGSMNASPLSTNNNSNSYASSAATPISSLSKKRSKSLTATQNNRGSIPKIRGRKPSLLFDDAKIFKCDMCERRFKRQEHLKRHVSSLHMGERPYSCDICLKSFSRSDNLNQHKRTHNNPHPNKRRTSSSATAPEKTTPAHSNEDDLK